MIYEQFLTMLPNHFIKESKKILVAGEKKKPIFVLGNREKAALQYDNLDRMLTNRAFRPGNEKYRDRLLRLAKQAHDNHNVAIAINQGYKSRLHPQAFIKPVSSEKARSMLNAWDHGCGRRIIVDKNKIPKLK